MKRSRQCVFRNKAAANHAAAAYRKQFGIGLDGQPRRYGRQRHEPNPIETLPSIKAASTKEKL